VFGGAAICLVHGPLADETLCVAGERHAGRREAVALAVDDDLAAVVPPDGDARVRRSEVDADRRLVGRTCWSSHLHLRSSRLHLLDRVDGGALTRVCSPSDGNWSRRRQKEPESWAVSMLLSLRGGSGSRLHV
jgi:hypothetical protein